MSTPAPSLLAPDHAVRAPQAADLARLRHELSAWLLPESPYGAAAEWPFLLGGDPRTSRFVSGPVGDPLAHLALHRRRLVVGAQQLLVGLIGAVATAPEHRGRGHASRLLEAALERARDDGLHLLLLWDATGGSLYARAGFQEMGREILFSVPAERLRTRLPTGERLRRAGPEDAALLAALHAREPGRIERGVEDQRKLLALPGTRAWIHEVHGRAVGYAVLGRGSDLEGCVHEWTGRPSRLETVLREICDRTGEREPVVMSPPWRRELIPWLERRGLSPHFGALGQVKLLDPGPLRPFLPERSETGPSQATSDTQTAALDRALGHRERLPATHLPFYVHGWDST